MQNVWGRTIRNFVVIIVIMVASSVPHDILPTTSSLE